MKRQPDQSGRPAAAHPGFVSGWLFSGAFLGLVIGLVEAFRLWTTPRVIPLLVPDVGWVIWFLAPLVDMTFFGLVGLGLGWLASLTKHKEVFVAVGAGITITFVTLMLAWFHREIGLHPFDFRMEVTTPLAVFTLTFVASLLILAVAWHRLAGFLDVWLGRLLKPLAWGLAASTVIALVGIGAFVSWPPASGPAAPMAVPPPSGAPNIVFITLDTVRADHLSSYGYSRPTTPNIDRFAKTGVLFENAIAPSSWTLASHASMFTGLLPQQHGADWAVPLESSPWTLAEILRLRGYETAGFAANLDYMQKGWGVGQGFGTYSDNRTCLRRNLAQTLLGNAVIQPLYQHFWTYDWFSRRDAQEINRSVYRWCRRRTNRPYFLFINYFDVHDPYVTNEPYEHLFGGVPPNLTRELHLDSKEANYRYKFTRQELASLVDGYDNCLAYLDSRVGKLLDFLRRSRQWQNTVVIVTSDHGEGLGGHGNYEHGRNLYREELRVPLIIAGPGVPNGVRISHLVGTRQLFSTVLDLAGHGRTPFSRTSLARFWRHDFKPSPFGDAVVSELVPLFDVDVKHPMISLMTTQWQYIEHRDGRQELYNWISDSEEKNSLAASPHELATVQRLRSRLVSLVSNATGPWRGPQYLQALDTVAGPARLSLLHPRALPQDEKENPFPIGIAQAFFKSEESTPALPTRSERDLVQSLPYQ
jgi:arylsulfatase A-like enzyme